MSFIKITLTTRSHSWFLSWPLEAFKGIIRYKSVNGKVPLHYTGTKKTSLKKLVIYVRLPFLFEYLREIEAISENTSALHLGPRSVSLAKKISWHCPLKKCLKSVYFVIKFLGVDLLSDHNGKFVLSNFLLPIPLEGNWKNMGKNLKKGQCHKTFYLFIG